MATCACNIVKTETSGTDWIIVRDTYDPSLCANPTIVISSATPTQVTQATEYLQQCVDKTIKMPTVLNNRP